MSISDHLPSRGQVAAPLSLEVVRELSPLDLLSLADAPKGNTQPPPLQTIKARHHRMAQLLAMGRKIVDVAIIVGSTPTRIQQHMKDPSFKELVAYYQSNVLDADFETTNRVQTKLQDVAETATDLLAERLQEHESGGPKMSDYALIKVAEFAADRSIAPPKTTAPSTKIPGEITITFGNPLAQPTLPSPKVIGSGSTVEATSNEQRNNQPSPVEIENPPPHDEGKG